MKNFTLFLMLLILPAVALKAQIVTGNAYIKGTLVEIGIDGSGGYEGVDQSASPPLPGMHPRTAFLPFGFVANPQNNGWASYNGDFFTPGSPENGWGFEIGTATTSLASGSNNCANFGIDDIPGALTNWAHTFNCYTADWEGNATTGTNLHFKISYLLQETDLYYTTTISVTNNTTATIPEMYYYRNLDPDNNEELSFSFNTTNTIVSQPGTGCNLAHVSAEQAGGSGIDPSYLGLAAVGSNWRATFGGFGNRDASDLWNLTNLTSYSPSLQGAVGASIPESAIDADNAISLSYKISNLAPGATETFKFVTILNAASATAAINNLLYFSYPGSASLPPAECTPYTDTVRTCGNPVLVSVNGPIAGDYSWSWTPTTGLTPATGATVTAFPGATTTYTVTGTPITPCVPPVTMTVVVHVTPGGGANPVITAVAPVCAGDPPFNLSADSSGGVWSGPGTSASGSFNPATAGVGTHTISYTIGSGICVAMDTVLITVANSGNPTITQPAPVCAGSSPITLTAATGGGTWSGPGITDPVNGIFTPTTAGAFVITYTIPGTCASVDTVTVSVASTTTPVTGFSYPASPVCIAGTNPTVTGVPSFTTGGTYSSTAGLSINALTGTVNLAGSSAGTYTVTYTVPSTTCGPAGTSTATVVITPLLPPVTAFSYMTPVCNNDTMQVPVHGSTFTEGGTYSSSPGLTIDPVTGVVNVAASAAGTYTISYNVPMEADSCRAAGTGTATLVINPLPSILISQDVLMYIGETATLIADGGSGYAWTSNSAYTCVNPSCDTIKVSPEETTTYCVHVDTLGCIDSACVRVSIEIPCPSNRNLVVPNAFTPDGDGVNDELCLYGWDDCVSSFQITIFDRWGEKVFESKDPSFCWDGVFRGKQLDPAVFVYYIQAAYKAEGATITAAKKIVDITKKGNISLVR